MQWDGPIVYKIPEEFKENYKNALKPKFDVTQLEKNTIIEILKDKGGDPIKKFQDRYKRSSGKKKYKDSTPIKDPIKANVKKRKKNNEFPYTENDLKLHWKTLMCFCKREWKGGKGYPLPRKEIESDKRDFYYIGRSDIDGKKVYFSVSEYIIPSDKDSHIFPNSFFAKMLNNMEYEIPQSSTDELFLIVQCAIRNSIECIIPTMVDGKKMWKCKHKGGHYSENQSKEWIDENFREDFEDTYEQLVSDEYLEKKIPCPAGKPDDERKDDEGKDGIPKHFLANGKVKYCFGDSAYCAFGNMANAMHLLKDDKAASFFFLNRFKKVADLLDSYTTLPEDRRNINRFVTAIRIVREKFGYTTKALEMRHEPWILNKDNENKVMYMEIQAYENPVRHVTCIYNGLIYDGALE